MIKIKTTVTQSHVYMECVFIYYSNVHVCHAIIRHFHVQLVGREFMIELIPEFRAHACLQLMTKKTLQRPNNTQHHIYGK